MAPLLRRLRTTKPAPHNRISFFRYLFPHTSQRALTRLDALRFEILPAFKLKAQSRIWTFILARRLKRQQQKTSGLLARVRARARLLWLRRLGQNAVARRRWRMSATGAWEEREPGARRKKFAGYLRAANDLRQTYQQSYKQAWSNRSLQDEGSQDLPGSYPGASLTSNGDAQLVLFPSYARRHQRSKVSIWASVL